MSLSEVLKSDIDSLLSSSLMNDFYNTLDESTKGVHYTNMQRDLNRYAVAISEGYSSIFQRLIETEEFKNLDNKQKADFIRNDLGNTAKQAFKKNADATVKVYSEIFKKSGAVFSPEIVKFNEERLKGAIAGSIKKAIEEVSDEVIVKDSFFQFAMSGSRETIDASLKKFNKKSSEKIFAARETTSPKPCEYCLENSYEWFEVGSEDVDFYRFHDSCKCRIVVRTPSLEEDDSFDINLEDEIFDDEITLEDFDL